MTKIEDFIRETKEISAALDALSVRFSNARTVAAGSLQWPDGANADNIFTKLRAELGRYIEANPVRRKYIVRVASDLEVEAATPEEAEELAKKRVTGNVRFTFVPEAAR